MVFNPASERYAAHPHSLSDIFDELNHTLNRASNNESIRLGVLLSAVGRRAYGPLLLMIGLFAISPATVLPGMTSVAGAITLLIAGQMALGMKRPWLPKVVLNLKLPRRPFFAFLDEARPRVERMEGQWLRPRLEFLSAPPFVNLIALCAIAAALITFPLSLIPFAPLAPGMAVVLLGLGMIARDGLWLLFGLAATAGAFALALPLLPWF